MNKIIIGLFVIFAHTLQINAQAFQIGSPAEISLNASTACEWENQKKAYGDMFVRGGQVALNCANRNNYCIREALLTEDLLSIRLFSNVSITARKTSVRTTANGGIYWTGEAENDEGGSLTLFMTNGYLTGTLRFIDKIFYITPGADGNAIVVELDLTADPTPNEDCDHLNDDGDDISEQQTSPRQLAPASTEATIDEDGNYIIDLLILYPTEVAEIMGNTPEARTAAVEHWIMEANEIFENSQINVRFRLAHDETNDVINKNTNSAADVRSSEVRVLRDQYGADIVSHWNLGGSAGSGYVWNSNSNTRNTGFNTGRYSEVITRYTFVHECGHNLGALHDRYEYNDDVLHSSPYYQFGKVWVNYRTVMAYTNCASVGGSNAICPRIKYFSNPNVLYDGVPTGVAGITYSPLADGGPANNARRINECAESVSACNTSSEQTFINNAKIGKNKNITISVNPRTGNLRLTADKTISSVEIFNLTGVKLHSSIVNHTETTISNLPKGVLLLKIYVNGSVEKRMVGLF
jgi:hypothetical protein